MNRVNQLAISAFAFLAGTVVFTRTPLLPGATATTGATEVVSQIAAQVITEAIPRQYERSRDWGRTRQITTGLRSSGNFFDFDIHRRKSQVEHGVWKKYRVMLIDPDKNLVVKIEDLRTTGPGRAAFTVAVTARLHAWGRAKVYEHGVHLIALEIEGDTSASLRIDAEISLESVPAKSFVPGVAIRPVITDARLKLDDFRLRRISDLKGPLVHELGEEIRDLIEDELSGRKLVASLNRSIEKRRDRLQITPDMLLGTLPPPEATSRTAESSAL